MTEIPSHLMLPILNDPGDDSPRLIAADWLDENGDSARAEFIRVQCRLHAIQAELRDDGEICDSPKCELCAERKRLQEREKELMMYTSHPEWIWPDECSNDIHCRVGLERGFLCSIKCSFSAWIKYGVAVVLKHPIVEIVLEEVNPREYRDGTWVWYSESISVENLRAIPDSIFACLRGYEDAVTYEFGHTAIYRSGEAAAKALHDAALLWAQRQAWPCKKCGTEGKITYLKFFLNYPLIEEEECCRACQGRGWRITTERSENE